MAKMGRGLVGQGGASKLKLPKEEASVERIEEADCARTKRDDQIAERIEECVQD